MKENIGFLSALYPPGSLFYLGGFTNAGPISGGIYNDPIKAFQDATALDQQPDIKHIYISTQPVNNYLTGQNLNTQYQGVNPPKNIDIPKLCNYFIDIDPIRESGTIALDEQVALTQQVAAKIQSDLSANGFPEFLVQFSGNGIQMYGKVDLEVSDENMQLLKGVSTTITQHYGTESVKIDLAIYNPSRLGRCPGTTNRKGTETEHLYHRKATVLRIPVTRIAIEPNWLQRIAAQTMPTPLEEALSKKIPLTSESDIGQRPWLNVDKYLSHNKISVAKVVQHGDAELRILTECLNNPNHGYGKAAIGKRSNGTMFYICFHDSCSHFQWKDARQAISGNSSIRQFLENGKNAYEEMAGTVISMADLITVDFPPTTPLIENIVSVGGATVISGAGGVGKSTLALLFALILGSRGVNQYLGLKVANYVSTLLVQAENAAADTKDRLLSMSVYPELKAGLPYVYSLTQNYADIRVLDGDFNSDHFFKRVLEDIRTTGAGLIIIDPLISFYKGEENDNSAMRRFLDRLTLLMSLTGISILIVHHVGRENKSQKYSSYAGRGASAVGDWAHNTFLLRSIDQKNRVVELSCQKARNFEKPEPLKLTLNQNLVFELANGGFPKAMRQRIIKEALLKLGGIAKNQKQLKEEMMKQDSNIVSSKAFELIKEAVRDGIIVEKSNGRMKTYHLPVNQQTQKPAFDQSPTPVQ